MNNFYSSIISFCRLSFLYVTGSSLLTYYKNYYKFFILSDVYRYGFDIVNKLIVIIKIWNIIFTRIFENKKQSLFLTLYTIPFSTRYFSLFYTIGMEAIIATIA